LSKDKSQKLVHQLSKGWLIYTKHAIFGISGSWKFDINLKSFESYLRGDHVKSNKFIIGHLQELVGQQSPSSSEDG
jgi:hypothetical protein